MNPVRDSRKVSTEGLDAADGVVVVDKPAGPTSHDVVAQARRLFHMRRVGHTGTLDPFATGVLPLVLGRATRLARFLSAGVKTYRATLALGVSTDTHDLRGTPLSEPLLGPVPPHGVIEVALQGFRGRLLQTPPHYSAKKVQGSRAYALARQSREVLLQPVEVDVFRLEVESLDEDRLVVLIDCSPGFYVRALARDLGDRLECGAHLTALRRLRSGEFDEGHALTLDEIGDRCDAGRPCVVPLSALIRWLPTAHLTAQGVERARHGNPIDAGSIERWEAPEPAASTPAPNCRTSGAVAAPEVRLCAPGGILVGIARRLPAGGSQAGTLQPSVVLV
jgi:tRNA pseudouridine55 synthase